MARYRGFSVLELLCVIAIITILASLLAGPVLRAYRRVKEMNASFESPGVADLLVGKLKKFFVPQAAYPAWSAEDLRKRGVFDGEMMRRIRAQEVIYHPFASSDSDDKVIAEVLVEKKKDHSIYQRVLKMDLYAEDR